MLILLIVVGRVLFEVRTECSMLLRRALALNIFVLFGDYQKAVKQGSREYFSGLLKTVFV